MSTYRVGFDKHGETVIRMNKDADTIDEVHIFRHAVTGWRAQFYVKAQNQGDAVRTARKQLHAISESLYWHLMAPGHSAAPLTEESA